MHLSDCTGTVYFLLVQKTQPNSSRKKKNIRLNDEKLSGGEMEEKEKETDEEDFPISHVCASVTCNHTLKAGGRGGAPLNGLLNSALRAKHRLIILEASTDSITFAIHLLSKGA
jgi:hypothetical protein